MREKSALLAYFWQGSLHCRSIIFKKADFTSSFSRIWLNDALTLRRRGKGRKIYLAKTGGDTMKVLSRKRDFRRGEDPFQEKFISHLYTRLAQFSPEIYFSTLFFFRILELSFSCSQ